MSILRTSVALATLTASSLAAAQMQMPSMAGGYVGFSFGRSDASFDSGDFSTGVAGISENRDSNDDAYKLFAGFDFNRIWAVEAGYADFGKPSVNYAGTGVTGQAELQQTAWFIAGKGTVPIGDFGLFGKLGITRNYSEVDASTSSAAVNAAAGFPFHATESRTDLLWGIGVEYGFRKQFLVRFEYEDFGKFGDENTGRTRMQMWTLGLGYKF